MYMPQVRISKEQLSELISRYRELQDLSTSSTEKQSIEVTIESFIDFFNVQNMSSKEWKKSYPYRETVFGNFLVKMRRAEMLVKYFLEQKDKGVL
jgi:hypothetical protein